MGINNNEFRFLGKNLDGDHDILRNYGSAEFILGGELEKESRTMANGTKLETMQQDMSVGLFGVAAAVKYETNNLTKEEKTTTRLQYSFKVGLGLNFKFEFFVPMLTSTHVPNK